MASRNPLKTVFLCRNRKSVGYLDLAIKHLDDWAFKDVCPRCIRAKIPVERCNLYRKRKLRSTLDLHLSKHQADEDRYRFRFRTECRRWRRIVTNGIIIHFTEWIFAYNGYKPKLVDRFLELYQRLRIGYNKESLARSVLRRFLAHLWPSDNSCLVIRQLTILCPTSNMRLFLMASTTPRQLGLVLMHAKKARVGLWDIWLPTYGTIFSPHKMINEFYITGNIGKVKASIVYGVSFSFTRELYVQLCDTLFTLRLNGNTMVNESYLTTLKTHENHRRCHLMIVIFILFLAKIKYPGDGRWMQCMAALWNTVTDPPPTEQEMLNFFDPVFTPESRLDICRVVSEYKNVCEPCSAPRSLRHLSRCCIRYSLTHRWTLPEGIHELDLPKHLIPYLELGYWCPVNLSE